jgi:isopentenyl-diphosphate delta-isomerase
MEEKVILVNVNDNAIGSWRKWKLTRRGMLHRAISVIVRNDRNEILMQQRALHKYHTPDSGRIPAAAIPGPERTACRRQTAG